MSDVRCKECKQPMAPGATCHGVTRAKGMREPAPKPVSSAWDWQCWDCKRRSVVPYREGEEPDTCPHCRFSEEDGFECFECFEPVDPDELGARWGHEWAAVAWMTQERADRDQARGICAKMRDAIAGMMRRKAKPLPWQPGGKVAP